MWAPALTPGPSGDQQHLLSECLGFQGSVSQGQAVAGANGALVLPLLIYGAIICVNAFALFCLRTQFLKIRLRLVLLEIHRII